MNSKALRKIACQLGIRGFVRFVSTALLLPFATGAQAAGRQVVHDHLPAAVRALKPVARYPGTNHLNLAIGLPLRNPEGLSNLLRQIYDPASPNYRHYLTPAQFTERFGPAKEDYQKVIAFAQANGLQVTGTHPNRMLVDVNGSVEDIEKALHLTMRVYQHPTEKRLFHAPEAAPSPDLAVPLSGISGLDDYSLPRPCLKAVPLVNTPNATSNTGSGPNSTFMGLDFRAAYVPDSSLDGSGQVVGLLEFNGYTNSDIAYYESQAGLPSVTLSNVLIDGATPNPGGTADENIEVCLDIDMAISMATNLSMVMVYMAPNPSPWEDLLNRMANDNLATELSCSWSDIGGAADPVADQIFQQMAAQGQSFFNSSGDDDAYTGLIGFPDDSPYTTQVGGTTLTTAGPGGSWTSETVWNWGSSIGSGGGISTQYPIPTWQQNISMADNQGSTTMRNTPDVALTANNIYVRANGVDYNVGGTSCAAPLWAGFAALVNQLAVASSEPVVGFVNAAIDGIGTGANYASAFHDITTGNNTSFNSLTKFYAVSGYDLCTGWGTPAGQNLINALVTNALVSPEVLVTPTSGFSSIGPLGGPFTITSQSFSLIDLGRSSLNWTVVNTSLWLNAFPGGGTLMPGEPAAIINVSLNSVASNLSVGTYTATVWFSNLTSGVGQSRQFTLNIGLLPVITTEPASQTVLVGGTAVLSVAASSTGPRSYQWQLNGADLPNDIITTVAGNGATNYFGDGGAATNASLDGPDGSAVDGSGNLFIADLGNNRIRKVDPNGIITTVAGNGSAGFSGDGGAATNASLDDPDSVAVDGLGNLFIADLGNNRIRKVDPNGIITTVAGNGNAGYSGDGGAAANASLDEPYGVAVDGLGNLFIADTFNNRIRMVDPSGTITTVAGNGSGGYSGDGGAATNASLDGPYGVAVDSIGNLFIADTFNNRIRELNTNGIIITVAGSGSAGYSGDGGAATRASLSYPFGVVVDIFDNVFIADTFNNCVREVDTNGIINTVAGNGSAGYSGDGGAATQASLDDPYGVTVDGSGNLFIADTDNNRIREVTLAGSPTLTLNNVTPADAGIYTVIVNNDWGSVTSSVATLIVDLPPVITSQPQSLNVSNGNPASFSVTVSGTAPLAFQWQMNRTNLSDAGNISNSDTTNLLLSAVTINDAGNYRVIVSNAWGSVTSSAATLRVLAPPVVISQPQSLTVTNGNPASFSVTVAGTAPLVYQWQKNETNLSDGGNISESATTNLLLSTTTTNDAGNYTVIVSNAWGSVTSSVAVLTIVIPPPLITQQPANQTVLPGGKVSFTVAVSSIGPATYQWQFNGANLPDSIITTVAGNGNASFSGDGGAATNASLDEPYGVTVDGFGNLFIADLGNNRIREVHTSGIITTVAGNGSAGFSGDGGAAVNARLSDPDGVTVDDLGNLFIVDLGNNRIRKVNANGIIATVAGNGSAGFSGDGRAAIHASLDEPYGVAVDGSGNLFIADTDNNRIRKVDASGIISTVAGIASAGYSGDGAAATNASLDNPYGVAVDGSGNLFIADLGNNRIREVDTNGIITTVAGDGNAGYFGDGGAATNASLDNPYGVTADGLGNLFIADLGNNRVRKVDTNGNITTVAGNGIAGYSGDGGAATNASLDEPYGVTADGSGNLFITDLGNNRVRRVTLVVSPTLTLNNVTLGDAGNYTVIISNAWGSVTSSVATLTVASPPVITSQPQSLAVTNGSPASFSVIVSSSAPLVCQWQEDGTNLSDGGNISDSGTTNLLLSIVTSDDAGNYTVIVSNQWGSVTSSVATLTVVSPPVIIRQPQSLTVTNGGPANFSVTVSGTAPLVCQWQDDGTNLSDGGNISDSATTNLLLSAATTNDAGNYTVIISNAWGIVTSGVATLTVVSPPVITSQPQSLTVTNGNPASFSVTVSGAAPLVCQWQRNAANLSDGGDISDSATTNLLLSPATTNNAGNYTVIVSNAFGSVTSSVAILTVVVPPPVRGLMSPPVITQQPANQTVLPGARASFSVLVSSTGPPTYQWQFNDANLPDNIISTVAGNGNAGFSGDGGAAANASLDEPYGAAVDGLGNLFIADFGNNRIRKVDTNGIITTVAGNGSAGYSGDGGAATHASLSDPDGVAVDALGNLFVVDLGNNRIRKVDTNGIITTVAGNGIAGFSGDGGAATQASLDESYGIAVDGFGNLFIADTDNNRIRKVNASGIITTVAGNGSSGYSGDGGAADSASLNDPYGVAVDGSGNLFIADLGNNRIREVNTSGIITTVAGNGNAAYYGDGGAATNASLDECYGVAVDGFGNLFIADLGNNRVRTVDTNGIITTLAGNGIAGYSGDGGAATNANLDEPYGATVDASGNLFITDLGNNRIREVGLAGSPTLTLNNVTPDDAGNYTVIVNNEWGSVTSSVATLAMASPPVITGQPQSLTVTNGNSASFSVTVSGTAPLVCQWQKNGTNLSDGGNISDSATTNLLLSTTTTNDAGSYTVIISNAWGTVTSGVATLTVLSSPVITSQPQSLTVTNGSPTGFSVTASGDMLLVYQWQRNATNLSDGGNISDSATTNLLLSTTTTNDAGNYSVIVSNAWGSATSSVAVLTIVIPPPLITQQPGNQTVVAGGSVSFSVAVLSTGLSTYQWQFNGANLPDNIITTVAGNGNAGYSGDGGAATNASLDAADGVAVDAFDNLFIADSGNNRIREVDNSSMIATVAGNGIAGYSGDGGAATNASLDDPDAVAVDQFGNLFIADLGNNCIRRVDINGIITTVAGNGSAAYSGDGGAATNASLDDPYGVTVDASGNLFIADTFNSRVRKVDTNGIITTVAGTGSAGYSGDGGAATNANLDQPYGVAVDGLGNLFIADLGNNCIRKANTNGIITTVAGNGSPGYSGDGGWATNAILDEPYGVALDDLGNLFIADTLNNRVREVDPSGIITTVAGNGATNYSGDGGTATNASLNEPFGVTVDGLGNLFIADTDHNRIRQVALDGSPALTLNSVTLGDAGNYTVIISNAWGNVTSGVATLTIVIPPPVIIQQPASQTVVAGGSASLSVTASGAPPLSYQWSFDGTNIGGATAASLILNNVQPSQAGTYTVLVTNLFGSSLSSDAVLTVTLDQFTWRQIPSPRYVNTPFSVTIQARDLTNGILTNFNGIAYLDSTNGVPVAPAISGEFVQGVWSGTVVISQSVSNLVLRAGDGFGQFGVANPINVIVLPPLSVRTSGNRPLLLWPVGYSGFVLESSGSLSPAVWTAVTNAPTQFGNQYIVPIQISGTNCFYRLQFSGP